MGHNLLSIYDSKNIFKIPVLTALKAVAKPGRKTQVLGSLLKDDNTDLRKCAYP